MTHEQDKCPHEELKEIFRKALRAKSKKERDRLRKRGLRRMWTAPEECFWPGRSQKSRQDPLYPEAADYAWEYIIRKVYGKVKGKGTEEEKAYDPDKGNASPISIWNKSCQGKFNDLCNKRSKERKQFVTVDPRRGEGDEEKGFDIDSVPQPDAEEDTISASELIAQARQMIEEDAEGRYKNCYVRQDPPPPITIQAAMLFILDKISRGENWTLNEVARHFNVPEGTMYGQPRQRIKDFFREIGDRLRDRL